MYNMFNQVGAIIASNIYQDGSFSPLHLSNRIQTNRGTDDGPRYATGNKVLISLLIVNIFIYIFTKVYYVMRNRQRDRKWNAMTKEERILYLDTTTDTGNKRLDFRFAH